MSREQSIAACLASADWLPPTSFSQQAFTGAQYGGVAPTRNPRALPQGGVERQRRKPSQRDLPHMDTELLFCLFAIDVDAVVVVVVVLVAVVVFCVLPAPSTILNSVRMSSATLVANSLSAPLASRGYQAGNHCPRMTPKRTPKRRRLRCLAWRGRSGPRSLPQPHVQGRGHSPAHARNPI